MTADIFRRIAAAAVSIAVMLTSVPAGYVYADETSSEESTAAEDAMENEEPSETAPAESVTEPAVTVSSSEAASETTTTAAETMFTDTEAVTETVMYTVAFAAESGFTVFAADEAGEYQPVTSLTAESGSDVSFIVEGTPFRTVKTGGSFVPSRDGVYTISDVQSDVIVKIENGRYSSPITVRNPGRVSGSYAILDMRKPEAAARIYYARFPYSEGLMVSTEDIVNAVSSSTDPKTAGIYEFSSRSPLKLYENGFYFFAFENSDGTYKNGAYTCTVKQIDKTAPEVSVDFVSCVQEMNGKEIVSTKLSAYFTASDTDKEDDMIASLCGLADAAEFYLVSDPESRKPAAADASVQAVQGSSGRYRVTAECSGDISEPLYIIVKDKAGNETAAELLTDSITTDNILLKVSYDTSDLGRSCPVKTECPSGWQLSYLTDGTAEEFERSFSISEDNKNYSVIVGSGGAEIGRTSAFSVSGLDHEPPEISIADEYNGRWRSAGNSYISVRLSEAGSSLYYYRSAEPVTDGSFNFNAYASVAEADDIIDVAVYPEESHVWYYYFYGADRFGNSTDVIEYVYMMDADAPVFDVLPVYITDAGYGFIQQLANTLSFDIFFDEQAYAAFSVSDAGGSDSVYCQYTFGGEWKDAEPADAIDGYEAYSQFIRIPAEENGSLKIKVTDSAGNETIYDFADGTAGSNVLISSRAPETPEIHAVKADGSSYTNGAWTDQNVIIALDGGDLEYEEGSLLNPQRYEYSTDGVTWNVMLESEGSVPDNVQGGFLKNAVTIKDEADQEYSFRASAYNGRVSESDSITVKIDRTAPANTKYVVNGSFGVLPDGTESSWYSRINSEELIIIAEPDPDHGSPVTAWYRLSKDGAASDAVRFTGDNFPEFSGDGVYTFELWTVDEAGNICEDKITEEIKVDTQVPECKELYISRSENGEDTSVSILAGVDENGSSTAAMKYYFSDAVSIITSFDFSVSGENSILYAFSDSAELEAADGLVWKEYDSGTGITAEPDMRFYLYVVAVDNAGNKTMVNSDGIIIDSEKPAGLGEVPEISIIPDAYHYGEFYNHDLDVKIYARDPAVSREDGAGFETDVYSGLRLLEYKVYSGGEVTQEGSVSLEEGAENAGEIFTISSRLNNTNDVIVEVRAVDMAGNERVTRTAQGRIRIDTTPPEVSVSCSGSPSAVIGNKAYFSSGRTASIHITERNFSSSDVSLRITNSGGSVPTVQGWNVSGSGDDTVHTGTITYSTDGDYTFDISFIDMAGNRCTAVSYGGSSDVRSFTIDRTAPEITVDYKDTVSPANGVFFNSARKAVITVREHNFTPDNVRIASAARKDGRETSDPADNIRWTSSGDVHTAMIEYSADGDYTFDISCSDMAGNSSGETDYGDSLCPRRFTVDKSIEAPEILVNGRSCGGKAYSGEAVISFSFSDINYAAHSVRLTHTSMGSTRDVTDELIGDVLISDGSCSVVLDDIPQNEQSGDGIYTLSVSLSDKAENKRETEVTFSVNRFGSVYVFDDYLKSLIADGGSYVKQLDEDIIITEYNANRLKKDSVSIIVTCDGRPVAAAEPVVESADTGEKGWYCYRYVLDKESFISDGVYKIVVSSEDEAGNTPENTNYDDQAILFCIDSTAPELSSVAGLEKSIINKKEQTVRYSAFDTMGLSRLSVYVDGVQVMNVTDFSDDINSFIGEFMLSESKNAQSVRIVIEDMAGNVTDTNAKSFKPHYTFNRLVTVSTNVFVRVHANKPLFYSIIGGIAAAAAVSVIIVMRRKKKNSRA